MEFGIGVEGARGVMIRIDSPPFFIGYGEPSAATIVEPRTRGCSAYFFVKKELIVDGGYVWAVQ